MTSDWDHPLIKKGMPAQLAKRRARIAAGEKPLGWKVGLGAPAAMQRVGITAPIVGYLMQRALLLSGSTASLDGWVKPMAEPEVCVRMMNGLGAGATSDSALAAIKEIFPAIELADFNPVPTPNNLDVVLEGDIYQRHVILCGNTRFGPSMAGLTSRLMRRGAQAAATSDLEALTGKLGDIVAHVANTLDAYDEKLSAGDVIITGSITPPIMIDADETELSHAIDPIGEVSVHFTWD
jgi:2-keto-4-pentenoate hydratase